MIVRNRHLGQLAAAFVALMMLSYASVRSVVMQVAMCDGRMAMPAMTMSAMTMSAGTTAHAARAHPATPAPAKPCPYCATAAHPPLVSQPAPLLSSSAVRFVAYPLSALHGPRGPPARRPRARDPPARLLSI